jgi:tetratricopeptide (TPR) repeat protein
LAAPSSYSPSPKAEAKRAFDEGLTHQKAERFQEAIKAYEASLRYDENQPEALNNLGFCYKSLKRYQRAISYYRTAIRLRPDFAEAHEYLGEAYIGLGKLDLARKEYQWLKKSGSDEAEELKVKIDEAAAAAPSKP